MQPLIVLLVLVGYAQAATHLLPRDACSAPVPNTCTFYTDCLEKHAKCGPQGYPVNYGKGYCDKFTAAKPKMSSAGKSWVTNTMLCLQQKLVPYGTGAKKLSCSALKDFAFDTHPGCYIKGGVCKLPPSDWAVIFKTVGFAELFGSWDSIEQTIRTMDGCVDFYKWLIKQGIGKAVEKVKDTAKSVWDKVTGWF
jgi:hypothetical protein